MNKFYIEDVEWAQGLERGLTDYMDTLWQAFWNEQEDGEDVDIVTESGIYFCGNDCCVNRETLFYVTPRIIQGYIDGKVKLTDAE
jgi:hypothetical protein